MSIRSLSSRTFRSKELGFTLMTFAPFVALAVMILLAGCQSSTTIKGGEARATETVIEYEHSRSWGSGVIVEEVWNGPTKEVGK